MDGKTTPHNNNANVNGQSLFGNLIANNPQNPPLQQQTNVNPRDNAVRYNPSNQNQNFNQGQNNYNARYQNNGR